MPECVSGKDTRDGVIGGGILVKQPASGTVAGPVEQYNPPSSSSSPARTPPFGLTIANATVFAPAGERGQAALQPVLVGSGHFVICTVPAEALQLFCSLLSDTSVLSSAQATTK